MNERIKQLAEQAEFGSSLMLRHFGTIDALTDSEQKQLVQIEKFAKLIIKECAEQIRLKGTDRMDWVPSQFAIRPEYIAMSNHIKDHFGVE